ncbi:oligosaccharide flippase family protein [Cellulomonas aerilata]|uniref:Lipopolysaccharide biosynthesis protein n=1 Tax=Cellulomonas aerilata TaxID=515326 RepID=A0A512DA14_9CELL|nr:oligosaccharide flippase family protein [Cellulomonas aerilata]GEO33323.1 hypothetical protein CAE01nite_10480 [Cellulomonas aerilata]
MTDMGLSGSVRRGLAWGSAGNIVLRFGNVLIGIVLARLLAPEDFGVFAIALAVQGVLVTFVDLGLSTYLVRAAQPGRLEPTVATLSVASGVLLAVSMAVTAVPVAQALGSERAAPLIALLAGTLVISAAGVVPYARMQREFQQREIFATGAIDLGVGTVVTLVLVLAGWGPMALAVSRLVAQPCATGAQFLLSRTRPRFGFDAGVAGDAVACGLPLAGANLLSMGLLAVDKVVLSRGAGEVALGYYVLAFNVASWPLTVIGQTIRPVALAAFARLQDPEPNTVTTADDPERAPGEGAGDGGLAFAVRLAWAAAVPVACLLAVLSAPVVVLLYGDRWRPAAGALAALAAFGALRVVFDLMATYLIARGSSRPVLWIQVAWILALVPAVLLGVWAGGATGAGWAQVAVAVLVVLPCYLLAVRRRGARVSELLSVLLMPVVAAVPTAVAAAVVSKVVHGPLPTLVVGVLVGAGVYALLAGRPVLRALRSTATGPAVTGTAPTSGATTVTVP